MAVCMADKKKDPVFTKREKCSRIIRTLGMHRRQCPEDAVGKAFLRSLDKWYPYCRKHLEEAKTIGCPTKLFSDTGATYGQDKP